MKRLLAALVFFPMIAWAQSAPPPAAPPVVNEDQKFGTVCAYPDTALRTGAVGETALDFRIADDGQIVDVKIVHSSGNADLDSAAAQCVAQWRTAPSAAATTPMRSGTIAWTIPDSSSGIPTLPPGGRFTYRRPTNCAANAYPPEDVKAGIEGAARVLLYITADGTVENAEIAVSSGHAELDQAALYCMMEWRFRPAMLNGHPIASSHLFEFRWTLKRTTATAETPASNH